MKSPVIFSEIKGKHRRKKVHQTEKTQNVRHSSIAYITESAGTVLWAGKCRKNDTGTKVSFFPDAEIFEKIYFKADAIPRKDNILILLSRAVFDCWE